MWMWSKPASTHRALGLALLAAASSASHAAPREDAVHAFVGVRVVTEDDANTVLDDATVLVSGGLITAVGKVAQIEVPAGARIHDGLGRTLVPGLIDAHVHLFGSGEKRTEGDADAAGRRSLYFGVTSVLDLNAPDALLLDLRARERADPTTLLPRIFGSLAAITVAGGHGTEGGFPARICTDGSPDGSNAKELVDELVAQGPDVVKLMIDEGGYAGEPPRPTLDDATVARLVELAHAHGKKVVAHVISVARARSAVLAGVDVLAHLPFVGDIDEEFGKLLVERGVVLLPTLAAYRAQFAPDELVSRASYTAAERLRAAYFAERFPALERELVALERAGVAIAAGSDAGMPGNPHGSALLLEIESYASAGLRNDRALRTATRDAAKAIGAGDRLGRISTNYLADLLLVDGNPLERIGDLRRVVLVMKGGNIVPRSDLESSLAIEKPRPGFLERRRLLDFESGAPAWHALGELAVKEKARDPVTIIVEPGPSGPSDGGHALRVAGEQSDGPSLVVKAGVEIDLSPVLPLTGFSDYRALRFKARAEGIDRYRILLVERNARDADHYGQTFVAKSESTVVEIPFSDFTQVGFGDRKKLDLRSVTAIQLVPDPASHGAFALVVDDVELIR